jgi:FKBP-type peptidyl-prolyl cis-trans isomerase FkpA
LHFVQKNDKDSVFISTWDNEMPQVFPVQKAAYKGDINDVLLLFGEGDSATFKVNLDTMAAHNPNQPKPEQFKNDKYITFTVKIEKVFKKNAGEADSVFQKRAGEFFQADYKATMDKLKTGEGAKLKKYLEEKDLKTTVSASGLNYKITAPGSAERGAVGDTLLVNYTGSVTKKGRDGKYKVFDTSNEKIAKEFKLAQPGRTFQPAKMVIGGNLIPGFSEGMNLIGKGGKITLIIPSNIGYGDQGNPQAGIPPYTPIAFDLEILDIIKGKGAPAAPATAAPVQR